jgi:hypothetical protein
VTFYKVHEKLSFDCNEKEIRTMADNNGRLHSIIRKNSYDFNSEWRGNFQKMISGAKRAEAHQTGFKAHMKMEGCYQNEDYYYISWNHDGKLLQIHSNAKELYKILEKTTNFNLH